MLNPSQERFRQGLARYVADSVEALGTTCTAKLLAGIALGLFESSQSAPPPPGVATGKTGQGSSQGPVGPQEHGSPLSPPGPVPRRPAALCAAGPADIRDGSH